MSVKQKTAPMHTKTGDQGTLFICKAKPEAKAVYLVGEFNNWNPSADRMVKRGGEFHLKMRLAPGKYQYKFLVDGVWHSDPNADQVPNDFGTTNSVIRVQRV